jgi:hypothetical protein
MAGFIEEWLKYDTSLAPHLALVGHSGAGKTNAVQVLLSHVLRGGYYRIMVLDWEEEYTYMPLPIYAPPFPVPFSHHLLSDALMAIVGRASELDHVIAGWLSQALEQHASFTSAAAALRERAPYSLAALTVSSLLESVGRYVEPQEGAELGEGVYLLSHIPSIRDREMVQKFLAMLAVLQRVLQRESARYVPTMIFLEKKWLNDDWIFFRRLFNHANYLRRIVFTSHTLPPPDILSSCELLLFDCSWRMRRALKAPIPDSSLKPGECWWVRRGDTPQKLRFELPKLRF